MSLRIEMHTAHFSLSSGQWFRVIVLLINDSKIITTSGQIILKMSVSHYFFFLLFLKIFMQCKGFHSS